MSSPVSESNLRSRLPHLSLRDEHRLRRRLDGLKRMRDAKKRDGILTDIATQVAKAEQNIEHRAASVPSVTYPSELPVSQKRDEIAQAIRDNQVVIVAGETGSGKTTQLPKICLELGRGVKAAIGHTQPRRLAARTVAQRVADELKTDLGDAVGYQVRFTRQAGSDTLIKLMTDGILLNELSHDRMLWHYDTLIVDEAHERSLNIDFILGYVKQLLPRRPDLKVIITSATIDPDRFAEHFDDAPIVEVSGRTYPVEVRYRPQDEDTDQVQGILDAVDELAREQPGDVLVFLSGEREIRDTADALRKQNLRNTEVLPLFARLSSGEQQRVFARKPGDVGRRIVLATNVAETSLTVPGIRYVVDPGTARISRYSNRTKVQRLPIEKISQASARQRMGRCGRLSDGVCIRLYSDEDFDRRPVFTDPEILRTNLASVILQMTALNLGEIASFPFLDPPDRRAVADGVNLLHELGAIDNGKLTTTGRSLSQLPIDPRLGRMLLEAANNGCAREVLVIVAALTIQDPRERPTDERDKADTHHRRFADPTSDFISLLNLWTYLRDKQRELSSSQFRKMCRGEFFNYGRVREWQDLQGQLRSLVKPLSIALNSDDAEPDVIHQSLLAGLLSHIGVQVEAETIKQPGSQRSRRPSRAPNEYIGARGAKFAIFPGSALFKKPPRWVMSAELVETSRLWARENARIQPEWIEPLASHLIKRTYSEPHWEQKRAAVVASEKVLLYGVPIVAAQNVTYSKIDPELCRDLFIRHALVQGEWLTNHDFFHDNRELLEDVEELEHKARRRDIVVDDETLFEFYDERIPADVVSGRHFDTWWKKARRANPDSMTFSTDLLVNDEAGEVRLHDFPDTWPETDVEIPLTYQFEPGTAADGVTAHIRLDELNQVDTDGFDWQVPGLREELVGALVKSMPKQVRRSFVPAPDTARRALASLSRPSGPITEALEPILTRLKSTPVPPGAWDWSKVPAHLKITFVVEDEAGRVVAQGKDLGDIKERLRPKVQKTISAAAASVEQSGLTEWTFGSLPQTFDVQLGSRVISGYPALVDEGSSVSIRVLGTPEEQAPAMLRGVRRLLLLSVPSPVAFVQRHLSNQSKLVLASYGRVDELLDDCAACAVDSFVVEAAGTPWDADAFTALRERTRADLIEAVFAVVADVEKILAAAQDARAALASTSNLTIAPSLLDAKAHLESLIFRGFVTATGRVRLRDVHRYVQAVGKRLEKLPASPQRDRTNMASIEFVGDEWEAAGKPDEVRWMIEEYRVSLFAQELGTKHPVSEKRILNALWS